MNFAEYVQQKGDYEAVAETIRERTYESVMNGDWWEGADEEYAQFQHMSEAEKQLYAHYEAKKHVREVMAMPIEDIEDMAEYDDLRI